MSRTLRTTILYLVTTLFVVGVLWIALEPFSAAAQGSPTQAPAAPNAPGASNPPIQAPPSSIERWFQGILWSIVLGVFGGLMGLCAGLLDHAINLLILQFGSLYQSSGLGFAVNTMWTIIRDIFNLTFIFGLIYIGFKLILDASSSTARKAIVNLVLAALLVNFSLFIAKFVIDFSNIAAVQVAEVIYQGQNTNQRSISLAFANAMGVSSIVAQGQTGQNPAEDKGYLYIFGTGFLLLVAAFSFLVGAVLIAVRFIALTFLMAFSPILFLGWVFDSLSGWSKQYWNTLLRYAFFAPAFLFMLYLSVFVLDRFNQTAANLRSQTQSTAIAASIQNDLSRQGQGSVEGIAKLLISAGFLIGAVLVAQRMGVHGASAAVSIMDSARNRARRAVTNTGRFAGRAAWKTSTAPVRYPARYYTNKFGANLDKKFKSVQANATGFTGKILRSQMVGNTIDRQAKAVTKAMTGAQFGTGTTNETEEKYNQGIQSQISTTLGKEARERQFNDSLAVFDKATSSLEEFDKAVKDLSSSIKNMSQDELSDLGFDKLNRESVAINLSDSQIDGMVTKGLLTLDQGNSIKNSRRQAQINVGRAGFAEVEEIRGPLGTSYVPRNTAVRLNGPAFAHQTTQRDRLLSGGEAAVGNLPVNALIGSPEMLRRLTPSIVEARMRNGISPDERREMRNALNTYWQDNGIQMPQIWAQWQNSRPRGAEFFAP